MELRHLRYFRAVAENQSFTRAARELHISQSGISGQISDLENELGVRLLLRNRHQVSLTPAGELFLRETQDILRHSEEAVAITVRASKGEVGRLAIGLCGPATAPFLPRLIRLFRRRRPEVELSLKDIEPARQPHALVRGEIDIGFTRSLPSAFRRSLLSELLFREPILAVLPREHALGRELSLSLNQLAGERFVLYAREHAPELFDLILVLCRKARFSPRLADTPNQWQSVLTMVEAGEGVALVPASVRHLRLTGVSVHSLRDRGAEADVILAWRRTGPAIVRDGFLDLLRNARQEIERAILA